MDFEALEAERQKLLAQYKKKHKVGLIVMACGIVTAVGGFFLLKVNGDFGMIVLILGIIAFAVGLGIASSRSAIAKKYSRDYKKPLVETLLKKWYDDATYEEYGGLPLAEIMNSGLLTRRPDRWHMEDLIQGSYHVVSFRTCDVHLEEMHQYTDSKGNTHTEWITFFRGRWYQFFLNRSFNTVIRIKEKKRIKEMVTRGLNKVEVESIDFTDKFMAYALDEHQFFYIFTPVVVEKMMQLEKMHKGQFMFSLEGNTVNFGIDDNRDYLEIKLKTPLTPEAIENYESQVNIMAAIVSEFRFDTEKYNPVNYDKEESNVNEINVSEEDMAEFTAKKFEETMENLDQLIMAKLGSLEGMTPEQIQEEVEKIRSEMEAAGKGIDNLN